MNPLISFFPSVLRRYRGITILIMAVFVIVTVSTANAQAVSGCITFLVDGVKGAYDMAADQYSGPYADKVRLPQHDWATFSPDGHYAAYEMNDRNKLWIQSLERPELPILLQKNGDTINPGSNIRWSMDSQWLVVEGTVKGDTDVVDQQLMTFDPQGRIIASYPLPYIVGDTTIDGWSADGKYFAYTVPSVNPNEGSTDVDTQAKSFPLTLVFSVPQLTLLNDKTKYPIAEDSCLIGYTTDLHKCLEWSDKGANVAYSLENPDTKKFTLIVQQLDRGITQQVDYKHSPQEYRWSPDGKWVAVLVPGSNTVDIVGVNSKIYFSVAGKIPRFCNEGCGAADMRWSLDSQSFYYVELAPNSPDSFTTRGYLKVFRMASQAQQIVFEFNVHHDMSESWFNNGSSGTGIFFSPDDHYVAMNNTTSGGTATPENPDGIHNEVVIINTTTLEKMVVPTNTAMEKLSNLRWMTDGKTLIIANDVSVLLWNAESKTAHEIPIKEAIDMDNLSLSADQHWLFITATSTFYAVNITSGELKPLLTGIDQF